MAKKTKEPVSVRFKDLKNGDKSIYLDIYVDGKRHYEFLKLYISKKTDAASRAANTNAMTATNAIKAQRILDITNGKAGITKKNGKRLLLDEVDKYIEIKEEEGKSQNYIWTCKALYKKLKEIAPKTQVKDVDQAWCRNFATRLKDVVSENSAYLYMTLLSSVFIHLVKKNEIPSNPIKEIKIRKKETSRTYLTAEELKKIINAKPKTKARECVKMAFLFSCFCGLRWSDIKALRWSDIYDDGKGKKHITITMQKTKDSLNLPLSEEAIRWMPARPKRSEDTDLIFADLPTNKSANMHLDKLQKETGIKKPITFHVARHTFATLSLTAGVDIYTTSKLCGHKSISTTQIYAKIIDEKKVEAVNKIANLFG